MTKRKTVTIVIIIAAVLLVGYIAVSIVVPRVMLHITIKETLADVGDGAEYFTEYSVAHREATFSADNGYIMIDIPAELSTSEIILETTQLFKDDDGHMVTLLEEDDFSDMNLLDREIFNNQDFKVRIGINQFIKGVESLGNGLPDSAFGTLKCAYMLDEEDYNPYSFNNQVAYYYMGELKQALHTGTTYVYENDDICGFIHVSENTTLPNEPDYFVDFDVYRKDNLNVATWVLFRSDDLQEVYAVINSARAAS